MSRENIEKVGDYIYHRTNNKADVEKIIKNGLKSQGKYGHNYFFYGNQAEKLADFYRRDFNLEQNPGDVLRINKKDFPELHVAGNNVVSSPDKISPNIIEIKTPDGWKYLKSDTSEAGQVVQAVEKIIGNKKYTFTPVKGNPFGNDNLAPKNSAYENAVIDQWFENELKHNFGTSSKALNAENKLKFTPVEHDPFKDKK